MARRMSKKRDEMDQNSDLLDRAGEIGEKEGGPKMNPTLQLKLQSLRKIISLISPFPQLHFVH